MPVTLISVLKNLHFFSNERNGAPFRSTFANRIKTQTCNKYSKFLFLFVFVFSGLKLRKDAIKK